jgi:hypothetical protein
MEGTLYQLEIKLGLARFVFPPNQGWRLSIHVDPMEIGKGPQQKRGKTGRARRALKQLREMGVTIGTHKLFGRVDLVAEHHHEPVHLVEVEGESRRQRDQALYSSLGQVLLSMKSWSSSFAYGIAVPDTRQWVQQLQRIPTEVTERLRLWRYLVQANAVSIVEPGTDIPDWSRA